MAFEINLKPIVIHQIIKNGFNPLRIIPVKIGLLLCLLADVEVLLTRIVLICNPANKNIPIAPIIVMPALNSENCSSDIMPIPNITTSGNSTIAWPIEIFIPDFTPYFMPKNMLDAKSGPGESTPELDTKTTVIANARNSSMCV